MAVGRRPLAWPHWELGSGPWELRSGGGIGHGRGTLTTVRGSVTVPFARAWPHSALSTRAVGHRRGHPGNWELGSGNFVVVISCPKEAAEHYRDRLESFGLTATIEPE